VLEDARAATPLGLLAELALGEGRLSKLDGALAALQRAGGVRRLKPVAALDSRAVAHLAVIVRLGSAFICGRFVEIVDGWRRADERAPPASIGFQRGFRLRRTSVRAWFGQSRHRLGLKAGLGHDELTAPLQNI
jgi:hypothetical protein